MITKPHSPHYKLLSERESILERMRVPESNVWNDKDRLYFVHGYIPPASLYKYTGLEILSELTWLPPKEIQRYIGDSEDLDKKYTLRLIRRYKKLKWWNSDAYDALTERSLPMLEMCVQQSIRDILDSTNPPSIFRHRKVAPVYYQKSDWKYISESTIHNHLIRARASLSRNKILLRTILLEVTDPYLHDDDDEEK